MKQIGSILTSALVACGALPTVEAMWVDIPLKQKDGIARIIRKQEKNPDKPPLSRKGMLALAQKEIVKESPIGVVTPIASNNPHLGGKKVIQNPFKSLFIGCALIGHSFVAPIRRYVVVTENGGVSYPFDATQAGNVFPKEGWGEYDDDALLQAAQLLVHLQSVANEDGWKSIRKPEDFLAIKFNMFDNNEQFRKQREAVARRITAPKIVKNKDTVKVTFFAWHLIGGQLREWTIQFSPSLKITSKQHGQFGGGGYD